MKDIQDWRRPVSISMPCEKIRAVDEARGQVSRSQWITNAIDQALEQDDERIIFE